MKKSIFWTNFRSSLLACDGRKYARILANVAMIPQYRVPFLTMQG